MEGQCLGRECDLWGKRQLSQGPHKFCAMWGPARMAETGLGGIFGRYMANLRCCQQELGSVTFSMLGSPLENHKGLCMDLFVIFFSIFYSHQSGKGQWPLKSIQVSPTPGIFGDIFAFFYPILLLHIYPVDFQSLVRAMCLFNHANIGEISSECLN